MRTFAEYNPIAVAVYFLAVAAIPMFSMNPVILLLSFIGAVLLYFIRNGMKNGRTHMYSLLLFLVMALINPLVSHNGVTVLFVMNDNPVTLEALIYGIAASAMIISVLYWFRSFSQIMTSERLLYVFGALSPKLALVLSMALRYVPLFGSQTKKINQAQKGLGLYKEDNVIDRFKGGLRVFSVMVTWALENGIITADSMAARGYGIGKRSRFSNFRFRMSDTVLLVMSIILAAITLAGTGDMAYSYYPAFEITKITPTGIAGYAAYGVLILLPVIIEGKEALRWKYLKSKI